MSQAKTRGVGALGLVSDATIDETVGAIVARFQPDQIILFGSYAYGQPQPESDVDLLVVMDTPLKEVEQAVEICQVVKPRYGLDLLVRKPATLKRRLALGDMFLREVVDRGKVLYERANG